MSTQLRLPIARNLRPPRPSIRDEVVALRIAERLVSEVNLDDFYWTPEELPTRVWEIQQEIMRKGDVRNVFARLYRRQPPVSCSGERGGHPYGWEGIQEHCYEIGQDIADDEQSKAIAKWKARYGV